ncbi:MAG TPA: GxxExxY protein [Candidatus Acidoferrales bacterium]|nr:GxxExxY protein [Candidatus Acidoferrales bacterium]
MTGNPLAKQIVDAAYRVHTTLEPGLLEPVYESALAYDLETPRAAHDASANDSPGVSRLVYHGVHIEAGFRTDLMVEELVIVEIKDGITRR